MDLGYNVSVEAINTISPQELDALITYMYEHGEAISEDTGYLTYEEQVRCEFIKWLIGKGKFQGDTLEADQDLSPASPR